MNSILEIYFLFRKNFLSSSFHSKQLLAPAAYQYKILAINSKLTSCCCDLYGTSRALYNSTLTWPGPT